MSGIWVIAEPIAIMAGAILLAVLGLVIVRRAPSFERHFMENEVAGLLFSAMGVVYGALLAFVVFATWESYAGAQQAVTQEAAAAIAAYRDTQEFPQPQRSDAEADLRAYVGEVMANEWLTMPAMAEMSPPSATFSATQSPSMVMATASPSTAPSMEMATASPSAATPASTPSPSMAMSETPSPSMAMTSPSPSMAMPAPSASPSMGGALMTSKPSTPAMESSSPVMSPSMATETAPTASTDMATPSASDAMAASSGQSSSAPAAITATPSPSMAMGAAPDPLNSLWTVYRSVPSATSTGDASLSALELSAAYDRLHTLELQRHLRHLSGESTLPWIFWPLLLMGGVIVVGFTYFFHQESHLSQALMTGVVTALLAGVLLLIFALNQPFTGPVPVSKLPFEHALAEFQAIDQTP